MFYGADSIQDLPAAVRDKNINRLLLVTDPGLTEIGLAEKVLNIFRDAGLEMEIFDGVHPNPLEEDVMLGVEAYKSGDYDGIIALGGGSAIDVA